MLSGNLCYYAATVTLIYVGFTTVAAASVAVSQESKLWKPASLPSLSPFGKLKVFLFNVLWMMSCLIGSIMISTKWILTLGTSDIQKEGNRLVEDTAARIIVECFVGEVRVVGRANLPPWSDTMIPAPVYIANHASQLDAAVVYYLDRRFKWIAKQSVLFLPGVGQVMWLSQHVFINRKKGSNSKSVSNLFEKSDSAVQAGIPMFFFPQGTRSMSERLPAKDGAFIVAMQNASPLVPISIEIPRDNIWNNMYPINQLWGAPRPVVTVTIHEMIQVPKRVEQSKGDVVSHDEREALKQLCMDKIYSVLPKKETAKTK